MKLKTTLLLALPLAASPAFAQFSYSGGHADVGIALEDGTDFHLHLHTHTGAVIDGVPQPADDEFDAGDVTIVVPASTAGTAGSSIPAAGVVAGQTLWTLPQGNPGTDTIPFLGVGTEELTPGNWTGDIVFTLGAVTSPSGSGTFSLAQGATLGGLDFYFSSADASLTVNGDNTLALAPGVHDHYNWYFNETGIWSVDLTVSGTNVDTGLGVNGFLETTETFTFSVVPEPSTVGLLIGGSILAFVLARRRRP
jgi:hypothetical protein